MEQKNIIFDLVGVLFSVDKFGIFRHMGMLGVLRYALTHMKDPFSVAYAVLDNMHSQEEPNYQVIRYKDVTLPRCITEWQQGLKTNKQAMKEIERYLYTPHGSSIFKTAYEREIINRIIITIFDAICLATYMRPINENLFLVKELKEYTPHKLYILSNFDVDAIEMLFALYPEFFSLFDGIVVSGQVGALKPYPEIYEYILKKYGLDPKKSLFIDDQQENIIGANSVGIPCIHHHNPWQLRRDLKINGFFS